MKILTLDDLANMLEKVGLQTFIDLTITAIESDLKRWDQLYKSPRHATHYPFGVIELMPCSDEQYYAFKYVNGHPKNPTEGKLSVVGLGVLADVKTGYPLFFSEMTLLTAIRTAATAALAAALAAKYLARQNSQQIAIVGTGAQSEFVIHAMKAVMPVNEVKYFDTDNAAMAKFSKNMKRAVATLRPCSSVDEAVMSADIVITATAAKKHAELIGMQHIKPGMHFHAMGGDCPGKTEFCAGVLENCKVVVEYLEQSIEEGEVQNSFPEIVYAELWELVCGLKTGRKSDDEITLFDSVGFALEDFSILRMVYQLCHKLEMGSTLPMIPQPADPKDLYGTLFSL
jgi:ornithine cyclodeaminase